MKLTFTQNDLLKSINIVSKAVPSKTTMSILECILVDASNGKIELVGNDTEFGIQSECKGNILEPGKVALESKLFSDIIRKLPNNDKLITIETDARNLTTIKSDNSIFKIAGRNGNEFTTLPKIDKSNAISIIQQDLKDIIDQTIFSTASSDPNKKMEGEFFEIKNDILRVTSLDGHRISRRKIELSKEYSDISAIIPGNALSEISKILTQADDEILMYISKNHILFEMNNTIIVSRLIDGEYFPVDLMLSEDYETKISVKRQSFIDNIDRSIIFVRDNEKQPLVLKIENNIMGLKLSSGIGAMNAEIAIEKTGKDLMIGFNPRFLQDALKCIEDEYVDIYMSIPRSPCFIRDEKGTYNYMILPVNFNVDAI